MEPSVKQEHVAVQRDTVDIAARLDAMERAVQQRMDRMEKLVADRLEQLEQCNEERYSGVLLAIKKLSEAAPPKRTREQDGGRARKARRVERTESEKKQTVTQSETAVVDLTEGEEQETTEKDAEAHARARRIQEAVDLIPEWEEKKRVLEIKLEDLELQVQEANEKVANARRGQVAKATERAEKLEEMEDDAHEDVRGARTDLWLLKAAEAASELLAKANTAQLEADEAQTAVQVAIEELKTHSGTDGAAAAVEALKQATEQSSRLQLLASEAKTAAEKVAVPVDVALQEWFKDGMCDEWVYWAAIDAGGRGAGGLARGLADYPANDAA